LTPSGGKDNFLKKVFFAFFQKLSARNAMLRDGIAHIIVLVYRVGHTARHSRERGNPDDKESGCRLFVVHKMRFYDYC